MNFAVLDTLIQIKEPSTALDDLGEHTPVWATLHEVFAQHRTRMGQEFYRADRRVDQSSDYFMIRPRPGITPTMRVETSDGLQYEITDVLTSDKRGDSILIACKRLY